MKFLFNQIQCLSTVRGLASFALTGFLATTSVLPAVALQNATIDQNNPISNATVWMNGCTGVLVTPDTVVSVGHCFDQRQDIRRADHSSLTCADREVPGQWYKLNGKIVVKFGNELSDSMFETEVTEYSMPGCVDIMAFKLEDSVPADIATPVKVVTRLGAGTGSKPAASLKNARLRQAGWGLDEHDQDVGKRRTTNIVFDHNNRGMFFGSGALSNFGDSGSPLYMTHWSGQVFLVGILQGWNEGSELNRYTPTFRNAVGDAPDVGWFFEQAIPDAVTCDTFDERPNGTVALRGWWHPGRKDNHATTDRDWVGCRATRLDNEYRYVRNEGYIFSPHLPQPEGTVRLNSWHSQKRGDYTTMSKPLWISYEGGPTRMSPDYMNPRLEGYVFDPKLPQPQDTIGLYRYWSPSRGDNFTTTQYAEFPDRLISPDYVLDRLVGYVFKAKP